MKYKYKYKYKYKNPMNKKLIVALYDRNYTNNYPAATMSREQF